MTLYAIALLASSLNVDIVIDGDKMSASYVYYDVLNVIIIA